MPPRNEEAERAVLGSMLFGKEAVDTAVQYLDADDFSVIMHKVIFNAIQKLDKENHAADIITTVEELRRIGELENAGGASYVASLTNALPSGANIDYYVQRTLDCSVKRFLFNLSHQILADVCDESTDHNSLVNKIEKNMLELSLNKQSNSYRSIRKIIPEVINNIEKKIKTKKVVTGVPSGFDQLDYMTSGFHPADYIVVGARPGTGKTALALSMVLHISVKKRIPAAFFSLEMSDKDLVMRMLAGSSRVDSRKIKTGLLNNSDLPSLVHSGGILYDAPFYIVDSPNMKISDLRREARRLKIHEKVEIIFIDYMTLLTPDDTRKPTYEQYSEISKELKNLARSLEIPVVVLSQLGRGTQDKDPKLSDIRASGGIEQDADLVIFLMREKGATKAKLRIEKQRNGETGDVEVAFLPQYMKFENLVREEQR